MTIIETASGKVRGRADHGVHVFRGIPYGASTAGENRFRPPQKPLPWAGVRDALNYGPLAMQPLPDQAIYTGGDTAAFMEGASPHWDRDGRSEDCLVLNVWTPAVDGGKRPVLFHCHGGGHWFGTGAADMTDGSTLARKRDVVVVDINHRLNIFGYLYLGELAPERYADSGNCGLLDIVAALQWVRDNIAAFGGDPGNVTVFGDSGGGSKVSCLLAMPGAKGLFHRAGIFSGPMKYALAHEQATEAAERVLHHLGIDSGRIDALQKLPAEQILQAMSATLDEVHLTLTRWDRGRWFHMFAPVIDGRNLLRHPFHPTAPDVSANVPLLIGTTADETTVIFADDTAVFSLDETGLRRELNAALGLSAAQIDRLLGVYRRTMPRMTLSDLFFRITSDITFRVPLIDKAERKAALTAAPVFMYLFTWSAPTFSGKFRSAHGVELPFIYDTVDYAPGIFTSPPDPRDYDLAYRVSNAFVSFAKTGDPNHPGMPPWRPYEAQGRSTMLIDRVCQAVNDPGREERLLIKGMNLED